MVSFSIVRFVLLAVVGGAGVDGGAVRWGASLNRNPGPGFVLALVWAGELACGAEG